MEKQILNDNNEKIIDIEDYTEINIADSKEEQNFFKPQLADGVYQKTDGKYYCRMTMLLPMPYQESIHAVVLPIIMIKCIRQPLIATTDEGTQSIGVITGNFGLDIDTASFYMEICIEEAFINYPFEKCNLVLDIDIPDDIDEGSQNYNMQELVDMINVQKISLIRLN